MPAGTPFEAKGKPAVRGRSGLLITLHRGLD